jgi:hypothetical protein
VEYWRLGEVQNGKLPGLAGVMPSKAVTFVDNHDSAKPQWHWPFPQDRVMLGYVTNVSHYAYVRCAKCVTHPSYLMCDKCVTHPSYLLYNKHVTLCQVPVALALPAGPRHARVRH